MRRPSLYSNSRVFNFTQYLCERNAHNVYIEYGADNTVRVSIFRKTGDTRSFQYRMKKNERGYSYELRDYDTEEKFWKLKSIGAVVLENMIRNFFDTSNETE